jgi:holo-[acyl-carrier protein] synthase
LLTGVSRIRRIERMAESYFGIGADIETISRFRKADAGSSFLNKIFTGAEINYCFSCAEPARHLAARFAGKEAIIKALSGLNRSGAAYKDIEITNDSNGMPSVRILKPGFDDLEIKLSLSHDRQEAIAFAVVTCTK